MREDLRWPKYGWNLIFVTFLMVIGMMITGSIMILKIGIDDNLPIHLIVLAVAGQIPYCFIPTILLFDMIFFILTWIETFGHICTKISPLNAEKCLQLFCTLQQGLGISFRILISIFTLPRIRIYILPAFYFKSNNNHTHRKTNLREFVLL